MRTRFTFQLFAATVLVLSSCQSSSDPGPQESLEEPAGAVAGRDVAAGANSDPDSETPDLNLPGGSKVELHGFKVVPVDDRASFFCFAEGRLVSEGEMRGIAGDTDDGGAIERQIRADEELKQKVFGMFDLMYDVDFGIACNTTLSGFEFGMGTGGIVDVGEIRLDEVTIAPEEGYEKGLLLEDGPQITVVGSAHIKAGHSYVVRTGAGNYGAMHITEFDSEGGVITFDWKYQPDGSRNLSNQRR